MIYIEVDDLIGNAFIAYLETTHKRVIAFNKIERYGKCVVNDLNSKGVDVRLKLSGDLINQFFYDYSDWFKTVQYKTNTIVVLNEKVTIKDLYKKFFGYLGTDVFLAFSNFENIKVLL